NKTLGPEVRFQLGEELIRGPEKQIALQFTNHALITETAENRAFSLTALRLRRYFIEIAFAPDDRASYLVPNEEQDCHADPNAGGRDQIPAQRNGDHHRDDRKIEAPRFLKQQPKNLTVEHSVGDHKKNPRQRCDGNPRDQTSKQQQRQAPSMIPARGVRPPLVRLINVGPTAPDPGIPPKKKDAKLPQPCPMSSRSEL